MKKWFFGLLTGFFLAFLLIAAAGVYGLLHSDRAVRVRDNTTLVLELRAAIEATL